MPLWRSSDDPTDQAIGELERESAEIEQKARECEDFIREAPDLLAAEQEELAATMPPPDDLADRRRERSFFDQLSRGQLRNERRAQAGSALLFLLLVAATSGLVMWVVRLAS